MHLIFVVDDEPLIANTTSQILRLNGFCSFFFINPYDALVAVARECPGLLIADLKMPGMSGLELAIRAQELCAHCGIILFTGQPSGSEWLAEPRERGFCILHKPASPLELLEAVAKIIGPAG